MSGEEAGAGELALVEVVAGKLIGRRPEEALALLSGMPETASVTLFSRDFKRLLEEVEREGLEVVAKIPLVGAVVVRGAKGKILRVSSLEVVVAVDFPRVVSALGEEHGGGEGAA